MNKNLLMVGILVALVLVATVQAVQLVGIKEDMKNLGSGTTIKKATTSAPSTTGSATKGAGVPTNLQNLPGMVGGC